MSHLAWLLTERGRQLCLIATVVFPIFQGGDPTGSLRAAERGDQTLVLRFKVSGDKGQEWDQEIWLKSAKVWYRKTYLGIGDHTRIAVCDGKTSWSYDYVGDEKPELFSNYDFTQIPKKHQRLACFGAYVEALAGLLPIQDPTLSPWKDIPIRFYHVKSIQRIGETKLDGQLMVLYKFIESEDRGYWHVWYAKTDGIVRKQVTYLRSKPWMTWTLTSLKKKEIPLARFQFVPPKK